ncbi:MAG: peroxiredoxin-like family protein [Betaproteobacteria bacterium]
MQTKESLASQLAIYKAGFIGRAPVPRVAMMEAATAQLKSSGIESLALKVGDRAPSLSMRDAMGERVNVDRLLEQGPVVAIFYRGGWCPYCNLALRAWQARLAELNSLGATLVAISPQTPDNSLSTREKNELAFPVLSDSDFAAAHGFGIAFTLPHELVDLYSSVGNNLPELNGNGQWVLPVPATFVIDKSGVIQFAHVEADYRERAEPSDVLTAIRKIAGAPALRQGV